MSDLNTTENTSIIQRAHALYYYALSRSSALELDPETTTWLIKLDARPKLLSEVQHMLSYLADPKVVKGAELMGLPIRWTVDDPDGTPDIQLVMQPLLGPR